MGFASIGTGCVNALEEVDEEYGSAVDILEEGKSDASIRRNAWEISVSQRKMVEKDFSPRVREKRSKRGEEMSLYILPCRQQSLFWRYRDYDLSLRVCVKMKF